MINQDMLKTSLKVEQVAKKLKAEYDELLVTIPREVGALIVQMEAANNVFKDEIKTKTEATTPPENTVDKPQNDGLSANPNETKAQSVGTDDEKNVVVIGDKELKSKSESDVYSKIKENIKFVHIQLDKLDNNNGVLEEPPSDKYAINVTLSKADAKSWITNAYNKAIKYVEDELTRVHELYTHDNDGLLSEKKELENKARELQRLISQRPIRSNRQQQDEKIDELHATYLAELKIIQGNDNANGTLKALDDKIKLVAKMLFKIQYEAKQNKKVLEEQKEIYLEDADNQIKELDKKEKDAKETEIKDKRVDKVQQPSSLTQKTTDGKLSILQANANKQTIDAYQKCLKKIKNLLVSFFDTNLQSYIHTIRKKYAYVNAAQKQIEQILKRPSSLTDDDLKREKKYQDQLSKANDMISASKDIGSLLKSELTRIDNVVETICNNITAPDLTREQDYVQRQRDCDGLKAFVKKSKEKLDDLYSNNVSIMDIILDTNFMTMYALKVIAYGLLVGAIFLTEKIFSSMYMQRVYANNGEPPNLMVMVAIFASINVAFSLFLGAILWLTSLIADRAGWRDFFINNRLVMQFISDYAISTIILFILLSIIATYMQQKVYFRYKTEGLRAIRALGDMTMSIAPVVMAVPYFAIF
jgi:hypothetical protein